MFRERWFAVNCTFDLAGQLVETAPGEGLPAFALNCDITTPLRWDGRRALAVDLWIDVLVRLDGSYDVVDEDDFAVAIGSGWLGPREIVGALGGLVELTELLDRGQLLALLETTYPFGPAGTPPVEDLERLSPDAMPELLPGRRPTWQAGVG